jgi:phage repressor protein C with HTH and peptisase S24 domain
MDVGTKIKEARERRGLSQEQLGDAVGLSQNAIAKVESGETKRSRFLARIARAVGLDPKEVDPDVGDTAILLNYRPPPEFLGERDLPVFTAAEGGPGEIILDVQPIDHVPRPWYLRGVRDGFAVVVSGESMLPVYEPGDMAIINPKAPIMRGKDAILLAGSPDVEGPTRASIKRITRWTAKEWFVHQFNPPEGQTHDFTLARTAWPLGYRVVGKYTGG